MSKYTLNKRLSLLQINTHPRIYVYLYAFINERSKYMLLNTNCIIVYVNGVYIPYYIHGIPTTTQKCIICENSV